jgi:uncharacterized membrane protein
MDTYRVLKFLHLASVTLWLGGGCSLAFLVLRVARTGDRAALSSLLRQAGLYGRAVVGPASLLTFLSGIGMLITLGISPDALWIRWGFIGILGHIVLGATLLRRATMRLEALATAGGPSDAIDTARRRYGVLNAAYLLLLLSVVGAMALKPTL